MTTLNAPSIGGTGIRDSTSACMERFYTERISNNPDRWCRMVTSFTGCTCQTFRRWFIKKGKAGGMLLLRLRILLDLMGYRPDEWGSLPNELKLLGKMIIYHLVEQDVATKTVGYYGWERLLKVLLQQTKVSDETLFKVRSLVQREDLLRKLSDREDHWRSTLTQSQGVVTPSQQVMSVKPPQGGVDLIVPVLAHQIMACLPLAQALASDSFTPADREKLRDLTAINGHSHGVFELSNLLNRLCGEKARESYRRE